MHYATIPKKEQNLLTKIGFIYQFFDICRLCNCNKRKGCSNMTAPLFYIYNIVIVFLRHTIL